MRAVEPPEAGAFKVPTLRHLMLTAPYGHDGRFETLAEVVRHYSEKGSAALPALKLTADYARAAQTGSGAEVDADRLADKAVVGTDWWIVRAGLKAGTITSADVQATGFSLADLERTVVTHDEHSALR